SSVLYRPPLADEHRWSQLARERMRLDYLRVRGPDVDLGKPYRDVLDAYDRGGLPFERVLTRLSYGRWLLAKKERDQACALADAALEICGRFAMSLLRDDCRALQAGAPARP